MLVAIVNGCGDSDRPKPANTQSNSYSTIKDSFHLLEGSTEVLPKSSRSHLARILNTGSDSQFKPTLFQRAITANGVAWVFLNGNKVCLLQGNRGAATCSPASHARVKGVLLGAFSPPSKRIPRPHDFLLMGLAPDGVARVAITIGTRRQTIPVRNNLFSASGDRPVLVKQFVSGGR